MMRSLEKRLMGARFAGARHAQLPRAALLALLALVGCSSSSRTGASEPSDGGGDTGTTTGAGDTGTSTADTGISAIDTGTSTDDTGTTEDDSGAASDTGTADDTGSMGIGDAGTDAPEGGSTTGAKCVAGDGGYAGDGACAALGCAGKSYKLCEDFEEPAGTVGAIPTGWTQLKLGYGSGSAKNAVLASDEFHSGARSMKSDSATNDQWRIQKDIASLGATATKHWGRVYYSVQANSPKPASGVIHTTFTALEGPSGENRIVDTVENSGGMHQWIYNLPSDGCSVGSAYDWKFEPEWHCAEWYVDVATFSFQFYTDAVEVPSISFTDKTCDMMSQYTTIALGTTTYQTLPAPMVVWFDDLAIDDNRIGCK